MRNKRGLEFNLIGMILGVLAASLFFGIIGYFISSAQVNYDTTGYSSADVSKYDKGANLSASISQAYSQIDQVTVDPNIFDFFAGIFNKILAPFKTIYRSFAVLIDLTSTSLQDLGLPKIISDFFYAAIIVIFVVGIVMIKIYMNRYT